MKNQQIQLAARPVGEIKPTDFTLVDTDLPSPGEGEVLVEIHYLAVEPAMKGWIEARVDYVKPVEIGELMRGSGSGVVIESNHPDFPVGTRVAGSFGWQRYIVTDGRGAVALRKIPDGIGETAALNVLGITGLTAYFGMGEIGEPKAGDTVLVSGAAGATGSVAGQLARIAGARVIGIAGGKDKCDWLVNELGFDGAIDYKNEDTEARVKALCPDGVDVYFDNTGGMILGAALFRMNIGGRIACCGVVSQYDTDRPEPGPKGVPGLLVNKRLTMRGFLLFDFADRYEQARDEIHGWLNSGQLRALTDEVSGLDAAPAAFVDLLQGGNIGTRVVRLD